LEPFKSLVQAAEFALGCCDRAVRAVRCRQACSQAAKAVAVGAERHVSGKQPNGQYRDGEDWVFQRDGDFRSGSVWHGDGGLEIWLSSGPMCACGQESLRVPLKRRFHNSWARRKQATAGEGELVFRLSVERIIVRVTMQVGAMPVLCCGRECFQQGGVLVPLSHVSAVKDAYAVAMPLSRWKALSCLCSEQVRSWSRRVCRL
jgi:hypothetical protein